MMDVWRDGFAASAALIAHSSLSASAAVPTIAILMPTCPAVLDPNAPDRDKLSWPDISSTCWRKNKTCTTTSTDARNSSS